MIHATQRQLLDPRLSLNQRVHESLYESRIHLCVDKLKLLQVIGDRLLKNRGQLLNCIEIQRVLAVDQGLEIFHLNYAFKNGGQLVTRQATVVEKHSVDD